MTWVVILPFLSLLLWALFARLVYTASIREGLITSAILHGVVAVLSAELLSLWHAIERDGLIGIWGGMSLLGVALLVWAFLSGKRWKPAWPEQFKLLSHSGIVMGCVVIVAGTAVIAWFAPPNNWDSLNYHMARVAHWAQEGSIAHFATGIEVQNYMPPANAIFMLHLYALGQSDRLVNFVQWFSMLGSMMVVSEISKRLGGGVKSQWLAAAFVVTLPMGIMQATSSTSDYVLGFWLAIVGLLSIRIMKEPENSRHLVPLGAAAGLSILTKQTSLPFLLPLGGLVIFSIRRSFFQRKTFIHLLMGLTVFVLVNLGYLSRNLRTYSSLAGPARRVELHINQPLGLRSFISSLVKNASLHAGTPSPYFNKGVSLVVVGVHDLLGLDVDDPGLTAEGRFQIKGQIHHETVAGNFPHAILIFLSFYLLTRSRRSYPGSVILYGATVLSGLLIFVFVFKWKLTGSRYHLPFFILSSPVVAFVWGSVNRKYVVDLISAVILLWSLPWLLGNQARPLMAYDDSVFVQSVLRARREDLYFANGRYLQTPYKEMTALIQADACNKVGISIPGGSAEYPFWPLLGAPSQGLEIEWIVADTPSAVYVDRSFQPCAVICDSCPSQWETVRNLPLAYERGPFRLYLGGH